MMIRTKLSLAIVLTTLGLVGCIGDDEESKPVDVVVAFEPVPVTESGSAIIPFPFDALFSGATGPTLNIPNASGAPFVANANMQDGFSTTASWFMDIFGFVDSATLPANVVIIETNTDPTKIRPLVYGVDFTLQLSTVPDTTGVAISQQRTRILIEPLKPLAPSTTYLVGLKNGIKTTTGGHVVPSAMFSILSSTTPVDKQTNSYLAKFDAAKKAQLEALRVQLIVPAVQNFAALGQKNLVMAYSVTTQSTTKTLDKLAVETVANPLFAVPIGKTPKDINPLLGNNSSIYVGTLSLPYYGEIPTVEKPKATLTSFWQADASKPDLTSSHLGKIPCGAYTPAGPLVGGVKLVASTSTTNCYPVPTVQSTQTVPVLMTVPNGIAMPEGGWPVVIFQHGITRNRTDMLAVAPALAGVGYVTIAIDLPLHGVDSTSPVYKNLLLTGSPAAGLIVNNERTFDVDFVTTDANGNITANVPDTKVDPSGAHFINLPSPITSRDNLRQGAADILVLAKSLSNLAASGVPINTSKVAFVGQSLGSIVGTVALGADKNKTIGAAVLSVNGGGIAKLLDGSASFGASISGGLAASKINEGTDTYETFMRFAQTLADAGDSINYAQAAQANHPILLSEVINDLVIPNKVTAGAASATQDRVAVSSFLAGTEPLATVMGLEKTLIDITNFAAQNKQSATGLRLWMQFAQGAHGSLLSPAANLNVTTEMQCQTAVFVLSQGTQLPIGCSK